MGPVSSSRGRLPSPSSDGTGLVAHIGLFGASGPADGSPRTRTPASLPAVKPREAVDD
jgi:hypothetical protein